MFNLAAKQFGGKYVTDFNDILDFGCGTGRLSRHFRSKGELTGCDINSPVISFCRDSVTHGTFDVAPLMPPLPYSSERFDLVVSFSVFSHLTEDVEESWLSELSRVGRSDCLYLLTVQGEWMIEATLGDEEEEARASGFYLRSSHQRHDSPMDFPDYYESTYHTDAYLYDRWSSLFEIIAIIRGDDPANYLPDGQRFEPAGDVPVLLPMGQDMVVARKRSF